MTALQTTPDRRFHRRIPVGFTVRCRRLGRPGAPEVAVKAIDLSLGGIRVIGLTEFATGDAVMLSVDDADGPLGLKGLVVTASRDGDRFPRCQTHVAFTGLSSTTRDRLGRIVALHDA